jgi:hypothetical protein
MRDSTNRSSCEVTTASHSALAAMSLIVMNKKKLISFQESSLLVLL